MSRAVDPITVEVIGHSVSSIVEEMGETLIRASYSTNIKERRDCSTALFDAKGRTLAQAEHIPIHLGSFIGLIEAIMERVPLESVEDGDTFVGNDAYNGGGTHLPDIVLASPIFFEGEIVAWAVNLAHHADFVDRGHAHIFQEGLRIPPVRLYRQGVLQEDIMAMIERGIEIGAPASRAYNAWTRFELFPRFMEGVEEVRQKDERHLHWRARVLGKEVEWEAEITEQIPDKRVAWRSEDRAPNAGVVTFHRLSDDTARVMLQMGYDPESWTEKVGDALGIFTSRIEKDLQAFKQFVEKHGDEVAGWRGTVSAKEDAAQQQPQRQ